MSNELIHSIFDRIAHSVAVLRYAHARKRRNSAAVHHLKTLPAYLHRDIGLSEGVDLAEMVEHGLVRRAAGGDTRRAIAILPHAV